MRVWRTAQRVAARLRLAARVLRHGEQALAHPATTSPAPGTVDALLEADYRRKLERLRATVNILVEEPTTRTAFRLVGPASDRSMFIRVVHRAGQWEPAVSRYVAQNLAPGDVFIDIGANLGYFTALAAKRVGPTGCVHAFEAASFTRNFLKETLRVNCIGPDAAHIHPVATWNEHTTLQFRVSRGALGGNRVLPDGATDGVQTETVEGHAVSEYLKNVNLDRLKLIKIDIEGAEIEALAGLRALIEKHPAEIVCELNAHCLGMMGHTLREFWDSADQLGCDLALLQKEDAPRPILTFEDLEAAYPKQHGIHLDVLLRPRILNQAKP